MKLNPPCYCSIILIQLSAQFFYNSFTSSFLSLSGALGLGAQGTHLLTPLSGQMPGAKACWQLPQALHGVDWE